MSKGMSTAVALAQLVRLPLVFTAVADIWLVVLWTYAHESDAQITAGLPLDISSGRMALWEALGLTAGVGIGMYVFGMALNDVVDVRRDRLFAAHRPLPSGRLRIGAAVTVALIGLLLAILCSVGLGPRNTLLALACAGLIVFYNGAGKHLPAIGIMTLGLVRGSHMLIGNPGLEFCWPVWLNMTHVMVICAVAHRLEGKRPRLAGVEIWILAAGWAFWTLALIGWMSQRGGLGAAHLPRLWVGPIVLGVVFLLMMIYIAMHHRDAKAAGKLIMRIGLGWLIVYDTSWLISADDYFSAVLPAALGAGMIATMAVMRYLSTMNEPGRMYVSDRV